MRVKLVEDLFMLGALNVSNCAEHAGALWFATYIPFNVVEVRYVERSCQRSLVFDLCVTF